LILRKISKFDAAGLRQTVHTHCASVHQAANLVAALLRVAGVTAGWQKVMAAYRRLCAGGLKKNNNNNNIVT